MEEFVIPQTVGYVGLRLCVVERYPPGDLRSIRAEITGTHVRAKAWVFAPAPFGLASLLESLATDWRGWSGAREMESVEGDLRIRCTCDGQGHVYFTTTLRKLEDPETWELTGVAMTEAGQLDRLAREAREFESGEGSA